MESHLKLRLQPLSTENLTIIWTMFQLLRKQILDYRNALPKIWIYQDVEIAKHVEDENP